ncbi:hypothetical protein [Pseudovibrio sp. WM33]|uniref:hypothetical protein n=1 Tax=Pseudovibrio sp. WM33 TaxID=1735585 RepID=UPI0007AE7D62|nr:hypothetical protein [Pseudovibrio sp. WM33]KZL27390.1 hypothetical protein PsWM33_00899 [Pseudovibrio sp. WM33]
MSDYSSDNISYDDAVKLKSENEELSLRVRLGLKREIQLEKKLRSKLLIDFAAAASISSIIFLFAYLALQAVILNDENFKIDAGVITLINRSLNILLELMIPFTFGFLGASARVLLSGLSYLRSILLLVASGLIASFAWISLKSKIFVSLVTAHLQINAIQVQGNLVNKNDSDEIYSLILVVTFVGMFASNIFIAVEQRVARLADKKSQQSNNQTNDN